MRDLCEWCIIILNISNASWCNFDLQSQDRRIDPRSMLPASSISVSMGVKDEQYGSAQMKCRVGYEIITVAERRNTIGYSYSGQRDLHHYYLTNEHPETPKNSSTKAGGQRAGRRETGGRSDMFLSTSGHTETDLPGLIRVSIQYSGLSFDDSFLSIPRLYLSLLLSLTHMLHDPCSLFCVCVPRFAPSF